jgi:transcriptional regulator with GAF, ATPase, and Fis domain
VRELLVELRAAAHAALADGNRVEARHLSPTAGSVFGSAMLDPGATPRDRPTAAPPAPSPPAPQPPAPQPLDGPRKRVPRDDVEWRQRIEEALRASGGNVAATARALGLHRTQLRRLLERYGIAVDTVTDTDDSDPAD